MALTYTAIATVTVGSGGAADIQFTSIPGTYTDLLLLLSLRSARVDTDDTIRIDFNSFAGTNLQSRRIEGNGASASCANDASNISFRTLEANPTASNFGNNVIYIPNYAGSNNKSVSIDNVTENNATTAWASLSAGLWSSSSAITAIKVFSANSANLAQYSTATLYGIKNTV